MASIPFPPTLDFSNLKPKGYSAMTVNREFVPAPFNQNVNQQDMIRFMINQHRGFWDPYTAQLDVEIDFGTMSPVGCLQLDGSAHSLISRLQIYVNGVSVELIDEYDSLLHFLSDMQYGKENKKMKMSEGVGTDQGFDTFKSHTYINTPGRNMEIIRFTQGGIEKNLRTSAPNQLIMNPWRADNFDAQTSAVQYIGANNIDDLGDSKQLAFYLSKIEPIQWNAYLAGYGTGATYAHAIPTQRYERTLFNNDWTFTPNNALDVQGRKQTGSKMDGMFSANFSSNNFEQVYSINYQTNHIMNGNVGMKSFIRQAQFQFPLGSSILGTLLPSESYHYIPFSALPDLVLEFTLNNYAFFTSGYIEDEDTPNPVDFAALGCRKTPVTQQSRSWRITKFNLLVDIILFDDPAIEDMINAQLVTNGILLHTCGWTLVLRQIFQNTSSCAGNFQINYGFESLKALFIMYELNDYKQFSFCRKHWRASRCVTSLQVRIGERIYPQSALQGHGGNALKYSAVSRTNAIFVQELYKAFNKQFTINSECGINMANFAPNKRLYDMTYAPAAMFDAAWTFSDDRSYMNLGKTLLWENQLRGMACYALVFDVLGNDNNVMGGIDTKNNVPFNILINTDSTDTGPVDGNPAEREATGLFYAYYDVLILFKAGQPPQKIGAQ